MPSASIKIFVSSQTIQIFIKIKLNFKLKHYCWPHNLFVVTVTQAVVIVLGWVGQLSRHAIIIFNNY